MEPIKMTVEDRAWLSSQLDHLRDRKMNATKKQEWSGYDRVWVISLLETVGIELPRGALTASSSEWAGYLDDLQKRAQHGV